MVAMLRRPSLVLILRHCKLLRCSGRRLLALVPLIAGCRHLVTSNQLVEIHEVLELGNALEQLLNAVPHGVHLGMLLLLLMVRLLAWSATLVLH